MRHLLARLHALVPLVLVVGCLPTGGADDAAGDDQARDIAQYDELADRLDRARLPFLGDEAAELQAVGKRVYWLQYASFDPTVHSSMTGARVDYAFPAGTDGNVRGSDELVVTATRAGEAVIYRAYTAGQRDQLAGEVALASPSDEQKWWAYAVAGREVYLVTTGAETTVLRWTPGQTSEPVVEVVLEQHGVAVGTFLDLMVTNGRMLFIESGRLWVMDLATKQATWVGNQKAITGGVSTDGAGVLYTAADGPFYLPFTGGETRDLRGEIARSRYQLNTTFASIHDYSAHAVLYRGTVVYQGNSGMFAYDLGRHEVTPLLLEPRNGGVRIVYTDPQILDTGTLYVTGLESTSGSVGADGPVYALDLKAALAKP